MGRILCVANQKGGVGKTTTACNVAAGLAHAGLRTLLVDLDPQCNATTGFGVAPAAVHPLVSDTPLHESIVETSLANLFVLPGSRSVRDVERIAAAAVSRKGITDTPTMSNWTWVAAPAPRTLNHHAAPHTRRAPAHHGNSTPK